jgi:hypothetical protein
MNEGINQGMNEGSNEQKHGMMKELHEGMKE